MSRRPLAPAPSAEETRMEVEGAPPADQPTEGAAPPADAEPVPAPATSTYLTAWPSDLGPTGAFVDLTKAEADGQPEGLLIAPTPEQLALRIIP